MMKYLAYVRQYSDKNSSLNYTRELVVGVTRIRLKINEKNY